MGFALTTDRNPYALEGFKAARFEKLAQVREPLSDHPVRDQLLIDRGTVRLHDQEQSASRRTAELDAHAPVGIVVHSRCAIHASGQVPKQGTGLGDRLTGGPRSVHVHSIRDFIQFPQRFR